MNNEVRKETNLEHYKEELKKMFISHFDDSWGLSVKIKENLDENIKIGDESDNFLSTDDILDWMAQPYKESVLDKAEKAYLRAVIKPFRSRVTGIALCGCSGGRIIRIFVKRFDKIKYIERVELPCFKTGTMYKGMEDYKSYSLEELGL